MGCASSSIKTYSPTSDADVAVYKATVCNQSKHSAETMVRTMPLDHQDDDEANKRFHVRKYIADTARPWRRV